MKRLSVQMPADLYDRIDEEASKQGISMAQEVRDALVHHYHDDEQDSDADVMHEIRDLKDRIETLEQTISDFVAEDSSDVQVLERDDTSPRIDFDDDVEPLPDVVGEIVDDAADDWYQGEAEKRRSGQAALEVLRSGWTGTGSDLVEAVRDRGDGVDSQNDDTMWRRTLRPVCKAAQEREIVTKESGTHVWEWAGPE